MMQFKTVGQRLPRHEAILKATGKALYTDDLTFSNLAYGKVLRSPHSHARVLSINYEQAKNDPDFLGILLPWEVPDKLYNCSGNPPSDLLMKDEKILTDHPLCVGDRIAVIAASSKDRKSVV